MDAPESVDKISAWLRPTDYLAESSEFRRHLATQAPGTGLWLCQTDEYRRWRDSEDCGSMWVKGVPGSGKSVVAASMIDLLHAPPQFPVLFFFFRQIVAANYTPRSLIKDWLVQLLPHSRVVQQSLSLCLKEDVEENCSDDQLWYILLDGLSSAPMVYCIADALDEMDSGNEAFLSRLNSLAAFRPASVKLFLTSRPKQYLQSALKNTYIVHVSLERDLVERDIAAFVWYRFHKASFKILSEDQTYSLQATICAKSQGLFLYAKLITDQVLESLRDSQAVDIETLAASLPVSLKGMYNDILFKQRTSLDIDVEIQKFLLQCVTHSARPLRLNELASALRYGFDKTKLPSDCKTLARTACGPLLQILEDETVQVIHHSFTEFLCDFQRNASDSVVHFPVIGGLEEHKMLLMLCISYLTVGLSHQSPQLVQSAQDKRDRDDNDVGEKDDKQAEHQTYPFDYQRACLEHSLLEYTVTNWTYHASHHNIRDKEVFDALDKFLKIDHRCFQIWLWLQWSCWKWKEPGRDRAYAVHIAAFGGLTEYARYLLTSNADVNQRDTDQRTALHWASRNGQADIAALLLEHGADANPADRHGLKPIHEAAKRNCSSVMRILLKAGVNVREPKTKENHEGRLLGGEMSTKGETPIEYACQNGNTESVCEMLKYMTQADLDEALCLAIRNDRSETILAIFAQAEPSPNGMLDGRTALYLASAKSQEETIRQLLARGADASLLSGHGGNPFRRPIYGGLNGNKTPQWTPIHGLVGYSNRCKPGQFRRVLQLLICAGVDIEAQDLNGDTALLMLIPTAINRPEDAHKVKILLECGANASAVDKKGACALHRSLAHRANLDLIKMLLDHGAKVEALKNCASVLRTTVSLNLYNQNSEKEMEGFRKCIELLLQHGAVCDFEVLKSAFANKYCNIEILNLLLASSKIRAHEKGLLLHHIGRGETRDPTALIELLVEQGADIETRNSRGQTPFLSQVSQSGNWNTAKALMDNGARWDSVDAAGQSALWLCPRYYAAGFGDDNWERLVKMGLDPLQPRNDGCNLLHDVALGFDGGEAKVAELERLIDIGLDINHKNVDGSPPLHVRQITGSNVGQIRSTDLLSILQRSRRQTLDINAQNNIGFTALHLAAAYSEFDAARLLDAGADASIQAMDGSTALHVACEEGKANIVGLLVHHSKTLVAVADNRGRTPLHIACASGRPESIYYLLKAGASVFPKDGQGDTPLHRCASFSGKKVWMGMDQENPNAEKVIREIINPPHLDPDIEYKRARTFQFCETTLYHESDTPRITGITTMLLAHGADASEKNEEGNNPLDLAILWGRQDMAEMLLGDRSLEDLAPAAGAKLKKLKQTISDLKHPSLGMLEKDIEDNDLYADTSMYSKVLTVDDLRLMVSRWHKEPQIEKGPYSLVLKCAYFGLTELMEVIGSACKFYDDFDWVERHRDKEELYEGKFQPPLQRACERETCNMLMVEQLVDQCGVDVNAHHLVYSGRPGYVSWDTIELRSGNTALHCLATGRYWWHIAALRWLVNRGADINARNHKGESPLHIASCGWRTPPYNLTKTEGFWSGQCFRLLLDLGANPNIIDDDGFTCLNKAIREPRLVLELLERGADMNAGTRHPLFSAINAGSEDAVAVLLDHGADINAPDTTDTSHVHYKVTEALRTPLFCAAMQSRLNGGDSEGARVAQFLLERGADWKATLNERETLVHYVFENANIHVTEIFLASPQIDYNLRDQYGRSVLHAACNWKECLPGYGHLHWFSKVDLPAIRLLDLGVDANAVDSTGKTALHHLLDNEEQATDITILFLQRRECKVLITRKDGKGFSPLHIALRRFRIKACDFLLTKGADLLDKDALGRTALHYLSDGLDHDREGDATARTMGHPVRKLHDEPFHFPNDGIELWQRYLSLGGEINTKDDEGNPPLFVFLASAQKHKYGQPTDLSCHIDTFPLLFKQGTDVFATNNDGETALHIVAKRRNKTGYSPSPEMEEEHDAKLFKMLMRMGLDPLAEDCKARSALDVAAACSKVGILEMFQQGWK